MAFCPKCGGQVSDDAIVCSACGNTLTPAASGGAGMPPPQPPSPPMGTQPPYAQAPMGAPPGYPPGTMPPPPQKQKTSSGCKIAIIVILAVILVIGAGVAVLALFIFGTVKAPVDVTNRYIEAINNGDAQEAWDLLHPDSRFRDDYSESTFELNIVEPSAHTLKTWNANEVEVSGSRAQVKVDLDYVDGPDDEIVFELRKDGDDWKIYDY